MNEKRIRELATKLLLDIHDDHFIDFLETKVSDKEFDEAIKTAANCIRAALQDDAEAEFQNLTPGGSEFQTVEECVKWIRDRLSTRAKQAIENQRLTERIERCRDYAMRIEENEITAADILEVLGYSRDGMIDLEAQQALQHKEKE